MTISVYFSAETINAVDATLFEVAPLAITEYVPESIVVVIEAFATPPSSATADPIDEDVPSPVALRTIKLTNSPGTNQVPIKSAAEPLLTVPTCTAAAPGALASKLTADVALLP